MLNLIENELDSNFEWAHLGIVERGREHLGDDMPVFMYRLFQFTIKEQMMKQFGKGQTIKIFQDAGKVSGVEYAKNKLDLSLDFDAFFAQLQKSMEESKIGILSIEEFDKESGKLTLTVGEDTDCSGLPVTGETVCNFDEGFIAGVLHAYTERNYIVTEIDCWATGSEVCRFEADIH